MTKHSLFRRRMRGQVINTAGPRHHWAIGFFAAVVVLLFLGVMAGQDAESDASVLAAGEAARAMEEGRALGRAQMNEEMLTGVMGAWQAGLAEGRKQCPQHELRAAR